MVFFDGAWALRLSFESAARMVAFIPHWRTQFTESKSKVITVFLYGRLLRRDISLFSRIFSCHVGSLS